MSGSDEKEGGEGVWNKRVSGVCSGHVRWLRLPCLLHTQWPEWH